MLNVQSLAEQVEDVLRDRILDGALPPGARIDAGALAGELGVSAMPVRDAIKQLERDGLVVVRARRGVNVAESDGVVYRQIMDVRMALETLAAETAVNRIPAAELAALAATYADCALRLANGEETDAVLAPDDGSLHRLIIRYCDNPIIVELWSPLLTRAIWGRRALDVRQRYLRSFEEHRWVLEALRARDRTATVSRLREHLTRARDEIGPIVDRHERVGEINMPGNT